MNKQSNPNGVNPIIDALLMRMNELDRFMMSVLSRAKSCYRLMWW
ncbi:hypothetical protein [Moraxella catarrhalis]|nr:hypothetical protein [Moraxella catarrhalis]AKI27104.1 hypothetical protein [Moraxella phage Mcat3]